MALAWADVWRTDERKVQTSATRTDVHQEGIWREQISQEIEYRHVTFRKPLPMKVVDRYVEMAIRHANVRQLDDGSWFAEINDFDGGFAGAWGEATSPLDALRDLEEVLFDWVLVKIEDEDRDLPELGDLNLNCL